jgi:hypothetical protein
VAALSKAWVCGRSLAGIAGSNSARAGLSVSFECCAFSVRGLRRAGHSSRGVLSCVCACVCVIDCHQVQQ